MKARCSPKHCSSKHRIWAHDSGPFIRVMFGWHSNVHFGSFRVHHRLSNPDFCPVKRGRLCCPGSLRASCGRREGLACLLF